MAVTRPIEEAVERRAGRPARPLEVGPRGGGSRHRFRPRHRHGPGAQRRPGADGRGRRAASAGHQHASSSGRRPRSSRSSRSSSPAAAIRRPCTTTPTTTCGRGSAASTTSPTSPCQGGDIREILVEVDPAAAGGRRAFDRRRGRPPGQGAPAQGRGPARPRTAAIPGSRQHARPSTRSTWKTGVIADKNGQPIRVRDLGRVIVSPRGPHRGDPRQRQGRRGR